MAFSDQFSTKEKAVIDLLLQGKSNKQIAFILHITPRTVEYHLTNIYNKLGVSSRSEAFIKLNQSNLRFPAGENTEIIRNSTVESPPKEVNNNEASALTRRRWMVNRRYIYIGIGFVVFLVLALLIAPNIIGDKNITPDNAAMPEKSAIVPPSPNPTQIAVIPQERAAQVLLDFLTYLHKGEYDKAALLYGGTYNTMMEHNPDIDPNDHIALLRNACTINGAQCLQVSSLAEYPGPYEIITDTEFKFEVGFVKPDGTGFYLGPCCGDNSTDTPIQNIFYFIVKRVDENNFRVMDMPPYAP